MESTCMINPTLPPGFRFHPTDEELIVHYLNKKVSSSENFVSSLITDIDLYKFNPWELPNRAMFGEDEWFFFSPRNRKYLNGARPNRAAASGYWKATGTDKPILTSRGSRCIGVKKALVFSPRSPSEGLETNWMMYEYRLLNHSNQTPRLTESMRLDDWVLCRIYQKSNTKSQQCRKSSNNNLADYDLQDLEGKIITENISYSIDYRIAPPKEIATQQKSTDQLFSQFLATPKNITSNEIVDENGFLDFLDNTSEYYISDGISEPQTDMQAIFTRNALATIRRVLSIGALDERFTLVPDTSLSSLTSDDSDNSAIIEISSQISNCI